MSTQRLGGVAEVILGRQRSPEHDMGPHMVPYLRTANVKDGTLDLTDVKSMNFTPAEQQRYALVPGDVLVSEGSGSLTALGANAVWNGEIAGTVCFQNTLLRLRPRTGILPEYLAYWARSAFGAGMFSAIATGANIFHVSAERVRSLPIRVPARDLQRAVCAVLDRELAEMDAVEAQLQRIRSLLDERRDLVVDGILRDHGDVDWVPLKRLARAITVGIVVTPSAWYTDDGGVPALRGLNVGPGTVDLADLVHLTDAGHALHHKSALVGGDVVVVRTGQAGAAAVVPEGVGPLNCIDLLIVRPGPRLHPQFLAHLVNSRATRRHVEQHSVGALQAHFNVEALREVPVPDLDVGTQAAVAQTIGAALGDLDRTLEALARQEALLAERRQVLITEAVTGRLDLSGVAA